MHTHHGLKLPYHYHVPGRRQKRGGYPGRGSCAVAPNPSRKAQPAGDKALLFMMQASTAMTTASNRLVGQWQAGGSYELFAENAAATREVSRKLARKIRATLPVTPEGAAAKRKHLEDSDGTEQDDELLAHCARYQRLAEELRVHGARHSNPEGARAEMKELRDAISAAERAWNMETVVAMAKVALHEAEGIEPCGPAHQFCRRVLADLAHVGGAL